MYNYGHWDLLIDDFDTDDYYGFIYIIINKINNRRYIGKRNFNVTGQHPDHWKKYTGSQCHLNHDIDTLGKDNFDFIIIHLCKTREELSGQENRIQMMNNILKARLPDNSRLFYNRTISNIKFDSSGIKRTDWIKFPRQYKTYTFINPQLDSKFTGTHIQLAEKLSLPSKRILRLLDGRTQTIAGWSLEGQDTANLRKFTRVIENVVTGEIFTGSLNEIIDYIGTSNWCLRDLIAGKQKTTRDWKLIK